MNIFLIIVIAIVLLILILLLIKWLRKGRVVQQREPVQLYVGNIPYSTRDHDLKKIFSHYGIVQQARIVKNSRTGRSKGFAFVTFSNLEEANKALAANGKEMKGRAMVVRIAKNPRHESS